MKYYGTAKDILEQLQPTIDLWNRKSVMPSSTREMLEVKLYEAKNQGKNYLVSDGHINPLLAVGVFLLVFLGVGFLVTGGVWYLFESEFGLSIGLILGLFCGFYVPYKMGCRKVYFNILEESRLSIERLAIILGVDYSSSEVEKRIVGTQLPYDMGFDNEGNITYWDWEKLIKQLKNGFQSPITVELGRDEIGAINQVKQVMREVEWQC